MRVCQRLARRTSFVEPTTSAGYAGRSGSKGRCGTMTHDYKRYGTHNHPDVRAWPKKHPRFPTFHTDQLIVANSL